MAKVKGQTFTLGKGVLILPNGEELAVSEVTITMGDRIQLIQNGEVVREEPLPNSPITIRARL